MLGMGDDYRVVAYKGDTQQGPYEGAFVYTKAVDGLNDPAVRAKVDAAVKAGGLEPNQMQVIDNTCPADATASGASLEDQGKEKLEWKDVFELTEWFRPGTLKKQDNFDPNAGIKSM